MQNAATYNQRNTCLSKVQLPGELLREVARLYTRAQRVVVECCHTRTTQGHPLVELGRSGPVPLAEIGVG